MVAPNLHSDEGKALAMVLTVLGEYGRNAIRKHLLARVTEDGYEEAKHTLDVMNVFERGFDQLAEYRKERGAG